MYTFNIYTYTFRSFVQIRKKCLSLTCVSEICTSVTVLVEQSFFFIRLLKQTYVSPLFVIQMPCFCAVCHLIIQRVGYEQSRIIYQACMCYDNFSKYKKKGQSSLFYGAQTLQKSQIILKKINEEDVYEIIVNTKEEKVKQ